MGCCLSKEKIEADYSNNLTKLEEKKEETIVVVVKSDVIEEEIVPVEPKRTLKTTITTVKTTKKVLKKKLTRKITDYEEEEEDEDEEDGDESGMLGDENTNEESQNRKQNLEGNENSPIEKMKKKLTFIKKSKITIDEEEYDDEDGEVENNKTPSDIEESIEEDEEDEDNEDYDKYLENLPPRERITMPAPYYIKRVEPKIQEISYLNDGDEREYAKNKDDTREKGNEFNKFIDQKKTNTDKENVDESGMLDDENANEESQDRKKNLEGNEDCPKERRQMPAPYYIKKVDAKNEEISYLFDSNEREFDKNKDETKEKGNQLNKFIDPKKNNKFENENNKEDLAENKTTYPNNFENFFCDDELAGEDDKKKKSLTPETKTNLNPKKNFPIFEMEKKVIDNNNDSESDSLETEFYYETCNNFKINIKRTETMEEFPILDEMDKQEMAKKFRSTKNTGDSKEIIKKLQEEKKTLNPKDELQENINDNEKDGDKKLLNPNEQPKRDPKKEKIEDEERDKDKGKLNNLNQQPIQEPVLGNLDEEDPGRDKGKLPDPKEQAKRQKKKEKEIGEKIDPKEHKDDDITGIIISEESEDESEEEIITYLRYKTTPVTLEFKFRYKETTEETEIPKTPNEYFDDMVDPDEGKYRKNFMSCPQSNPKYKFPEKQKPTDTKNNDEKKDKTEEEEKLKDQIKIVPIAIFKATKKILFRKLYPFEIIIEEETVSKKEVLVRRTYVIPKTNDNHKYLPQGNIIDEEKIEEEIYQDAKIVPTLPPFKISKKIFFRKLYPYEIVIEEETINTHEYIIRKVIMGEKNKNTTNGIKTEDRLDQETEMKSLLDKRRFTGLKAYLNHKNTLNRDIPTDNEIDEKDKNSSEDVISNTIPFVFDLVVRKLAFVLTKGEINTKFLCELNPEVKISFGNRTKIFQYSETRIGSKTNIYKDKNNSKNLTDAFNNSTDKKLSDKISQSPYMIKDVKSSKYNNLDFENFKLNKAESGLEVGNTLSPESLISPFLMTQASRKLSDPLQPPYFNLNEQDAISPLKEFKAPPLEQNLPIFEFDTNKSIFPLSDINLIKEQKENNFIHVTVSQVEPSGDKFILGEGYISILSILEYISAKFLYIYIPIFYQVENIQIAYIKMNLPTYIPSEILDELPKFEEDEENEIQENNFDAVNKKEKLFTKKIVTYYEIRYYIEIQMIIVILTFEERKLRSFIKNKIKLILEKKASWDEIKKFLKSKEDDNLIDETRYLIFISTINEIINESEIILRMFFFNNINYKEVVQQIIRAICLPFTYKQEILEVQNEIDEKLKSETKNSSSRKIPRTLKKFDDSLPREKKSLLIEIILQFYITIIQKYEEILILEEFSVEFFFLNFEKKFFLAKESHHKIMLEFLRYFQLKKNLKISGKSPKTLKNPKLQNLLENPVNPPEQNPNFIANKNLIIKFIYIVKNYITILTKSIKSKTINLFSTKKTFEILKSKIPIYFLDFGSKKNSKGISKYEFLLCYTDVKIIILILEILIDYVKLGSLLGYRSKSKLFHSEDDSSFKNFFDYLFKNFIKDKKILNLVLNFVYELFYTIDVYWIYEILKLINLKYLFTFFIRHNKKVSSKNFKNWIYFFSLVSKITKLIKTSQQEHIDFIYCDWEFVFENISILYILSLDNFTKIPKEAKISNKEDSLQMFTSSNYMNKKFAIQIQMLFFHILKDFTLRTELIKKFYNERKKTFRKIFDQICFLCLLSFQDSHLVIAEKEMRRFYFKMLVTLMMILNTFKDECEIDIIEEFKLSLKVIVPSLSGKLSRIMTIDNYLLVMIPKLKNLIDMNVFDDCSYFERKVTEMVNKLKT